MKPDFIADHQYRAAIEAELHARPVELVGATLRARRLVFAMPPTPDVMRQAIARFREAVAARDVDLPEHDGRQLSYRCDDLAITWEFHTEFITVSWLSELTDQENWPPCLCLEALQNGQFVAASRIDVTGGMRVDPALLPGFQLTSLCLAGVADDAGEVATDFVVNQDGFTRLEAACGNLTSFKRSVMGRRLLEVETYRVMALMGLPLARQLSPALRAAEEELTAVTESLGYATDSVQTSLDRLHALSVQTGQLGERMGYRFAASSAYGAVLRNRLSELNEIPRDQGSTLAGYIGDRVEPALATCAAMEKRLHVLSGKIANSIELLNARIGLDMQVQNKAVLDTIAATAESQFRLQRTVEGLSTIAISYYLIGILGYTLAGPLGILHLDKVLVLSIAAPAAVLAVWLTMRSIRKRHATHN